MEKKKNKNLLNILIIAVIFVGILIYMIYIDGIDNIVNAIKNVRMDWVIAGIACMVIYWVIEAICLYAVTKKSYPNQRFRDSLRVSMIGQLFNCITPFSSGGQPMQAVAMVNEGKSISDSASILLIKFIVYQATLVFYTIVVIILKFTYFRDLVSNFIDLAMIGFIVNFGVIIFLILIGINQKLVYSFVKWIYIILSKMRLLKDLDGKLGKLKTSITNFHEQFQIIKKEKLLMFRLVIYTIIQLTVYFLVTYMVYRAFGQHGASIINIISAQAFLMMIMAFVPIPGAGIAAEGGFLVIFSTFFESGIINIATLFWRMYTFYLPIIVGSVFLFVKKKRDKKEVYNMNGGISIDKI